MIRKLIFFVMVLFLLAELEPGTSEYRHRPVDKDIVYSYALTSIDSENKESQPVYLTVR